MKLTRRLSWQMNQARFGYIGYCALQPSEFTKHLPTRARWNIGFPLMGSRAQSMRLTCALVAAIGCRLQTSVLEAVTHSRSNMLNWWAMNAFGIPTVSMTKTFLAK